MSFFRPEPVFRLQYMVAIGIYAFQYCLETRRTTFNPIQLCIPLTLRIQKNTRLEIIVTTNNYVHFNDECYFEDGQITDFHPVVLSK